MTDAPDSSCGSPYNLVNSFLLLTCEEMLSVRFLYLFIFSFFLGFGNIAFPKTPEDEFYHKNVRVYIQKYCANCHNEVDKKAGLNLADVYYAVSVIRKGEMFQKVAEEVQNRNMPPQGEPQLTPEEVEQMVSGINALLSNALSKPDPGEAVMRRLSHREYRYTLLDLVGIDFDARNFFPSEGSGGEGFDNQSRVLFITPVTMERYYAAADSILSQAYRTPTLWTEINPQPFRPGLLYRWKMWWNTRVLGRTPSFARARTHASQVLIPFATRAFRRFLNGEEQQRLLAFFDQLYAQSWNQPKGYDQALLASLKSILVSPHFLYRYEANLPQDTPYPISNLELATRLSYLLWSSMPDQQLFDVAYRENLHDPKVLRRELHRMMADPKFQRFTEAFASQWLEIETIRASPHTDLEKYPEFTEALQEAMYEETVQYFYHVFSQSRNLLDLLDSDYTFLNATLAQHYDIEGITGSEMRKVVLPHRNRGGVLGMGAVLTSTSLPLRTSPVLRGKWVLEQLLGTPPPPPPPDVPELESAKESVKNELDLRALLNAHRAPSSCSGCHQKMDPIGLGLENFDAVGKWREVYGGNQSIDASGVLVSGESFEGPAELKLILLEKKELFAKNLARKLLSYALGRGVGFKDTPALTELTHSLLEHEFDPQELMFALVNSYPFKHKRSDLQKQYEGI